MAQRQIGHRKSSLVLTARFSVAKWRSHPVAKSAYYLLPVSMGYLRDQGVSPLEVLSFYLKEVWIKWNVTCHWPLLWFRICATHIHPFQISVHVLSILGQSLKAHFSMLMHGNFFLWSASFGFFVSLTSYSLISHCKQSVCDDCLDNSVWCRAHGWVARMASHGSSFLSRPGRLVTVEVPDSPGTLFHTLYSVMQLLAFPLATSFFEFVIILSLFQMVVVWDVSHAVRGGEMSIIAKAHTDVDICRMRIAEFDDSRYCKLIFNFFFASLLHYLLVLTWVAW